MPTSEHAHGREHADPGLEVSGDGVRSPRSWRRRRARRRRSRWWESGRRQARQRVGDGAGLGVFGVHGWRELVEGLRGLAPDRAQRPPEQRGRLLDAAAFAVTGHDNGTFAGRQRHRPRRRVRRQATRPALVRDPVTCAWSMTRARRGRGRCGNQQRARRHASESTPSQPARASGIDIAHEGRTKREVRYVLTRPRRKVHGETLRPEMGKRPAERGRRAARLGVPGGKGQGGVPPTHRTPRLDVRQSHHAA